MRYLLPVCVLIFFSCNNGNVSNEQQKDSLSVADTPLHQSPQIIGPATDTAILPEADTDSATPKVYNNKRFRDVRVEKTADHSYRITGEAQVFEAAFSWVVEDGHNELKQGHEQTDAGAPEWGKFSFTVNVAKRRPNSTLMLILFEASAKDGSRQYELPVVLR
jgi:hypothetical protein